MDLHRDKMKLGLANCWATLRETFVWLKAARGHLVYLGETEVQDADGSCVVAKRAAHQAPLLEGPCDIRDELAQWKYYPKENRIKLAVNPHFCWQHVDGGVDIEDQWCLMDCKSDLPAQNIFVERRPRQYPPLRGPPVTHEVFFEVGAQPTLTAQRSLGAVLVAFALSAAVLALRRRRSGAFELLARESVRAAE